MNESAVGLDTMSGIVARWLYREGNSFIEAFDLHVSASKVEPPAYYPDSRLLSIAEFRDVSKTGPSIIYQRPVGGLADVAVVREYFSGNLATVQAGADRFVDLSSFAPMDLEVFHGVLKSAGTGPASRRIEDLIKLLTGMGIPEIAGFELTLREQFQELEKAFEPMAMSLNEDQFSEALAWRLLNRSNFLTDEENPRVGLEWSEEMAGADRVFDAAEIAYSMITNAGAPVFIDSSQSNIPRPVIGDKARELSTREEDWYRFHTPEIITLIWGGQDPVWDAAAASGWGWLTARTIAPFRDELLEVVVLVGMPPNVDPLRGIDTVLRFLKSEGFDEPITPTELFNTHYARACNQMAMVFKILRRSELTPEDYLEHFGRPM